jgi:hypothetical protein
MNNPEPNLSLWMKIAVAVLVILAIVIVSDSEAQTIDQVQANKSSGNYNAGSGNVKATAKQQQQQAMQQSQNIVVNVPDSLGAFSQSGNPLSTSQTDIQFAGDIIPDNTPNLGGSSIYPSNPCHMVFNAGVSIPGFGANGGKTYIDQGCSARELARMFYGFGARDIAFHILCEQPEAKGIPGCNGVQDYNKEIALVRTDNEVFLQDYERMDGEIDALNGEIDSLKESLRDARMKRALEK